MSFMHWPLQRHVFIADKVWHKLCHTILYQAQPSCIAYALQDLFKKEIERLKQVLMRPVHIGPTINNLLPMFTHTQYLTLRDASSGLFLIKLVDTTHICTNMQVQTHRITIQHNTCRGHVTAKNRQNIQEHTNHIWYWRWHSYCKIW